VAATIPNCKAYDPAFAGELAVLVERGMQEMMVEQKDVFYYITLMNENYAQPDLPEDANEGVMRGCYLFNSYSRNEYEDDTAKKPIKENKKVTLLGSGAILTEVIKAAEQLTQDGHEVHVISVTSWSELARDGMACEASGNTPWLQQVLQQTEGDIIAASDYVRQLPESIRAYIPAGRSYKTLGTDGFGRSDTRANLRKFFNVDAAAIAGAFVTNC
jgi:pyruvate dehydrogenase E1 component